jgi:hypothetical protein
MILLITLCFHAYAHVVQDWPLHRRVISWGARLLARPLSPLSDPMTGFFAVSAAAWKRGKHNVSPLGFKVGGCLACGRHSCNR